MEEFRNGYTQHNDASIRWIKFETWVIKGVNIKPIDHSWKNEIACIVKWRIE